MFVSSSYKLVLFLLIYLDLFLATTRQKNVKTHKETATAESVAYKACCLLSSEANAKQHQHSFDVLFLVVLISWQTYLVL